jgi:quercetin dioxygenase-like cupin family protein
VIRDAHVVVATDRFDDDLNAITADHGFRVDAIHPADAPATAIVSAFGVRLRLERCEQSRPITLHLLSDDHTGTSVLPGGSTLEFRPFSTGYALPDNTASLVVTHADGESGVGRAGMRYRDLIPDRWGGRFVASHITIPEGGPVPDYVHFHKVRFQMIFVKAGWVRLVYEDQGEPFVMVAGDCVLQPPEIRHRVLESSPGLEVIEIGCPALHETIADWSLSLPNTASDFDRRWDGQTFVRHIADEAPYRPWRLAGWEQRDTGIGDATAGLAGARVARAAGGSDDTVEQDTEFAMLVVLSGEVTFQVAGRAPERLRPSSSVAIPAGTSYRLLDPTSDCELLDVTLPA